MAAEHRKLRFKSMDEAMAEAERLAALETRTTGHFSLGQREVPPAPLPMKILSRIVRPMVLRKATTGFKLPAKTQDALWPSDPVSTEEGLAHLREAYGKFKSTSELPKHVFFGKMTRQQHDALQCRHFEGHLGFVHPV